MQSPPAHTPNYEQVSFALEGMLLCKSGSCLYNLGEE